VPPLTGQMQVDTMNRILRLAFSSLAPSAFAALVVSTQRCSETEGQGRRENRRQDRLDARGAARTIQQND